MNELLRVLALSLLPAAGNFTGGLMAEWRRPSDRALNWALHAAAGVVVAIVAVELVPRAIGTISGWWIAAAFFLGGCAYILIESFVERRLESAEDATGSKRMWMIYIAVAVDLLGDGIMIGTGAAVSSGLAIVLAVGQLFADLPEGYATIANFRDKQVPRSRRILLSASFAIPVVGATVLSYLLLRNAADVWKMGVLMAVAGLLTVAAVEDMMEEAHENAKDTRRSVLAFIGGFALFTCVSACLGQ